MTASECLAALLPQLLQAGPTSRVIMVLDADDARLPCMRGSVSAFVSVMEQRAEMLCIHDEVEESDASIRTLVYAWAQSQLV